MIFNKHYHLNGTHAFLSASNPSWINYDELKLDARFRSSMAAQRGTELHAYAHEAIRLRRRQLENDDTVNMYINDGIGFRMESERTLFYSYNCYGTPDTISFRKNFLRIHDLKTGVTATTQRQLQIYEALFCLEYGYKPMQIDGELRVYQNGQVHVYEHEADVITHIMDKIVTFDKRIEELRSGAYA